MGDDRSWIDVVPPQAATELLDHITALRRLGEEGRRQQEVGQLERMLVGRGVTPEQAVDWFRTQARLARDNAAAAAKVADHMEQIASIYEEHL